MTNSASCNLEQEELLRRQGIQIIAGVDEAGRGCLAGPVVAAAVILPHDFLQKHPKTGLTDSKKLSPKRREALAQFLQTEPEIHWAIGQASAPEIDQLNILRATHLAMRRALESLSQKAKQTLEHILEHALVDGLPVNGLPIPHTALVKGDSRSLSIAAASILAKTHRDALMLELDKQYPSYGFAQHKGYGTKAHQEALKQAGPSPEHRQSFAPVHAATS